MSHSLFVSRVCLRAQISCSAITAHKFLRPINQSTESKKHSFNMNLTKQLLTTLLSILTLASPSSAYDASSNRRVLKPNDSIANAVASAHANGNARPHLTITADIAGASETVSYNVREAESAITAETTITTSSGDIKHVDPNDIAAVKSEWQLCLDGSESDVGYDDFHA